VVIALIPQLGTADVGIDIRTGSVTVDARYEFDVAIDSLHFSVIKVLGQQFRLVPDADPIGQLSLTELPGLYRIRVNPHADETQVDLRYQISGDVFRIPIAVPNLPAKAGGNGVRIVITGVSPNAAVRDGFPRLARQPDGTAVARMENLPSLIRLPPNEGELSANRLADGAVVLLVLVTTAYWVVWRRTRARAAL
jgi:hypothetical protein